jgi:hypothetical protein
VYGENVEIIAIAEICKLTENVYFVSEDQITPPLTVVVSQVATGGNVFLLFSGERSNDHYNTLLPA